MGEGVTTGVVSGAGITVGIGVGSGMCVGRSRTDHAPIAVLAVLLGVRVDLQNVTIQEFRDTRGVIAEHIGHHVGQLWANDALSWAELVLKKQFAGRGRDDLVDSIVRLAHSSIGEYAHGRGVVKEANA